MSVVDYLLDSIIKKLQKTQRKRKRVRVTKKKSTKAKRGKTPKRKAVKKKTAVRKKKAVKKKPVKKPVKKKVSKKVPQKKKSGKNPAVASKKKTTDKKKSVKPGKKVKKPVKKAAAKTKVKTAKPKETVSKTVKAGKPLNEVCIGEITHFFSRIQVVVLKMTAGSLSVGEKIRIKGKGTDVLQKAGSLQIESVDVKVAHKGQLVGLKVNKGVKVGSKVYKVGK